MGLILLSVAPLRGALVAATLVLAVGAAVSTVGVFGSSHRVVRTQIAPTAQSTQTTTVSETAASGPSDPQVVSNCSQGQLPPPPNVTLPAQYVGKPMTCEPTQVGEPLSGPPRPTPGGVGTATGSPP
jgi:hypothetical protein